MENNIINLNDQIGAGGITGDDFLQEYNAIIANGVKVIDLMINSPGGSIFDGHQMCDIIDNSPTPFDAYINGIACSMASVIPLYCRTVYMSSNAMMMIHNPSAPSGGESKDLRRDADLLDKLKSLMLAKYVAKTGLPAKKISEMMDAETWMTAQEAKQYGFIDRIITPAKSIPGLQAVAKAKPDYEQTLVIFKHQKEDNMEWHKEIPKALGLKNGTPEQVVIEIKRLKAVVEEAERDNPVSVSHIVAKALYEGLITEDAEPELKAMGTGNVDILKQYINRLKDAKTKETAKQVDAVFIRNAEKLTYMLPAQMASLRAVAMIDPNLVESLLVSLPKAESISERIIRNDNVVTSNAKPKSQWTLEDYRKNAPGELERNPALYKALCDKQFNTQH